MLFGTCTDVFSVRKTANATVMTISTPVYICIVTGASINFVPFLLPVLSCMCTLYIDTVLMLTSTLYISQM